MLSALCRCGRGYEPRILITGPANAANRLSALLQSHKTAIGGVQASSASAVLRAPRIFDLGASALGMLIIKTPAHRDRIDGPGLSAAQKGET